MERNDITVERFNLAQIRRTVKAPIICVYKSPADYPDQFVARLWDLDRPTRYIAVAGTLEEIRATIPEDLIRFRRDQSDDPCIVESWI